jgi:hypothetical protein
MRKPGTEITRQEWTQTQFRDDHQVTKNVLTKTLLSVFDSVINTPTNQSGEHRAVAIYPVNSE